MEYDRSNLDWVDWPKQVFALMRVGDGDALHEVHSTRSGAEIAVVKGDQPWGVEIVEVTLHQPSLRAVYGGPTLIEALWSEMDRLMEGLMTGQDAEDGGDRFRAAELAWVLAIVTNAYDPSVDRIRAEAMERWNAQQQFEAEQEAALNPEEDDFMTRPEGADQ